MAIINNIIKLLNETNHTQKELTDYLEIPKSVFSAWKSGDSKSYNKYLANIADFFEVPIDYLLDEIKCFDGFNNLYKTINILCEQNNLSVLQMCTALQIPNEELFELKTDVSGKLSKDMVKKIADYFFVTTNFLNNGVCEYNIPCPLCDLLYVPEVAGEIQKHNKYHRRWQNAVKRFGFCWANSKYRNEVKSYVVSKLESGETTENLIKLYEARFKVYFSRAVMSTNRQLDTITFEDYVSGLLANKNPTLVPNENSNEYKFLVGKYGIKKGILDGTYFAVNNNYKKSGGTVINKIPTSSTIPIQLAETVNTPIEESIILTKYIALDNYGKKVVDSVLNIEYDRCTKQIEEEEPPTITIKHSFHKVSAGHGFDLNNEDDWEDIEVPDTPEARRADFSLTISGDSMEPIYSDGDIVLVKAQPAVDIGETGIFVVNGSGYIKQNGGDRLMSLNPEYDDITFCDGDTVSCAGKVIGIV